MPIVHVPVAFPENTPLSEMRRIAKAVHERGKQLAASKAEPTARRSTKKFASALGAGDNEAQAVADRLSKTLESADSADNQEIYQAIISYRKLARKLPPETRATLDRKIATYSNSQVKAKTTKRK
jgi:hypothetical protein